MEARVGTLPVGTQFDTLLTGRRGVVRAQGFSILGSKQTAVELTPCGQRSDREFKALHPDVRVRVVEAVH